MGAPPTFLFAGGGTGGHLFPGIAVAQELQRRDPACRLVFVGSNRQIESTIANQYRLQHRSLPVESLAVLKRNPIRFVIQNLSAWRGAKRLISELKPTAVIGLGGFASAPLVWVASRKRIPIVLLEQNVIAGRTTRWLGRIADRICVTFESTQLPKSDRVIVTGNPVRDDIAGLSRQPSLQSIGDSSPRSTPQNRTLLALGGSQGANSLNLAFIGAITKLNSRFADWSIVHQTGPRQAEDVRQKYKVIGIEATVEPFLNNMAEQYARAEFVISRAGATTLSELACAGLPMILMPYPHAADDHQRANAKVFVDCGAGLMVEHSPSADVTVAELAKALELMVMDKSRRAAMSIAARTLAKPDAAATIADVIASVIAVRSRD